MPFVHACMHVAATLGTCNKSTNRHPGSRENPGWTRIYLHCIICWCGMLPSFSFNTAFNHESYLVYMFCTIVMCFAIGFWLLSVMRVHHCIQWVIHWEMVFCRLEPLAILFVSCVGSCYCCIGLFKSVIAKYWFCSRLEQRFLVTVDEICLQWGWLKNQ